ncbi:uncharacterized protein LOC107359263 [Tetranychus urticae]|uniref:Large ribosomal subunit protein mL49 n=1 Tax=Tetranychus urticae TaxID=32264 RepID=T1K095_TETUR|nr:uncharacterized protein LOC107359263 [Tetranychus urticae]
MNLMSITRGCFKASNLLQSQRVVPITIKFNSKLAGETDQNANTNADISLEKAELMKRLAKKYLVDSLPYPKVSKEDREFLSKGFITEKLEVKVADQPIKYLPELDPDSEPFNHIYKDVDDKGFFTRTENITEKDPDRWFWVERLIKRKELSDYPKYADQEPDKQNFPSGYTPISKTKPNLPYFIRRTRSGMFPVYKLINGNDEVHTFIKFIDGDVWKARDDIINYLKSIKQLTVEDNLVSVNEVKGALTFKGNHVLDVVGFLNDKGF